MKPNVYRELVNDLRDTAVEYANTQQLRERLSSTLRKYITPDVTFESPPAPAFGNSGRGCKCCK